MGSIGQNESGSTKCGMLESAWMTFGGMSRSLGKDHAEISVICKVKAESPLTQDRLLDTWTGLGIEYPNLRAVPVESSKHYVEVDEWARQTFAVKTDVAAATVLQSPWSQDLPRLLWLPSTSEVIFVSSHWRIDGIGALMLVGRMLERLADIGSARVKPPEHPSLILEEAAGADTFDNPALKAYGVEKAGAFHDVMFARGNLPYEGDASTLPGPIGQYGIVLTEASTRDVVQRCKQRGITVTAAVNFSLAQMVFSLSTSTDVDEECRTMISADPRPHLAAPHNSRASACNIYVLGTIGIVPRNSTFDEATVATTKQLKTWFNEDFRRSLRWFMGSVSTTAHSTPPSGVYVSNLGQVQQHVKEDYGTLKVEAFHLGVATMTRQMTFHIWTFKGRMTLSLNYNCRYHHLESVQERLRIIQAELGKGLGLSLEAEAGMAVGGSSERA